ncbi:MAG: sugar phosphate isomerase/epimerase [Propionicimonas sp.]|uniref:sugar phosphate isomerase/epimerase family protein n=1 Tax=Propionicimonas sp. TaxID=1955623 RepID=UPI002B21E1D5|nr:sugar phosphate isomerase/epimerase [Propionicimonas sp.]MEA4945454.1 sugar phosphate isomerase/epimerase [Propionicimonas sp.]
MSIRIGLQLFSVRQSLAADPWGTLARIAEEGFAVLEAANHSARTDPGVGFGVEAGELRQRLADLGLSIIGCHINPLDVAILPRALDYQAELGNSQFGCDIEFYPYGDRDFVLRRCETFNEIGELARQRGMRFYYHNHFQEFQRFGDEYVYDIILANTDPELVKLEMDTYWMYRGGQDPLEWMSRCADRVILLHQKDFPKESPQPLNLFDGVVDPHENIDMAVFEERKNQACFTEIGTGILPIQSIVDLAATLPNFDYMLLEQDHAVLPELESIRVSHEAFENNFTNVAW